MDSLRRSLLLLWVVTAEPLRSPPTEEMATFSEITHLLGVDEILRMRWRLEVRLSIDGG
jgi:hypothetical protein